MRQKKSILLPTLVFLFTFVILSMIQLMIDKPVLMLERFIKGGGWIEVLILSSYGAFIIFKMQDKDRSAKWRIRSWAIFSIFFFTQLVLGILIDNRFLLTGKLHIPVPAMMIAGPLYRGQASIMTLLFLSTILLSGPAWCSQLCYFGAIDGMIAQRRKGKTISRWKQIWMFKMAFLFILILTTLLLRWANVTVLQATIYGVILGILGVIFMIVYSSRKGKMIHCLAWCPIGTLVHFFKFFSPFRLKIEESGCTMCMRCSPVCKYDALKPIDLKNKKPGLSCTLCGDCLSSCKDNVIKYQLFKVNSETARNIYLFITISLHVIFMAMGRI